MALVITVTPGQGIEVDQRTKVGIQRVNGKSVRLVVLAPDDVQIKKVVLPPDPTKKAKN